MVFHSFCSTWGNTHLFLFFQAQTNFAEASSKLQLLRTSLDRRLEELTVSSNGNESKIDAVRKELEGGSPTTLSRNNTLTKTQQQYSSLAKPAALTGKLQVRLVGCQDLLEDIPWRVTRRDSATVTSPSEGKSFMRSSKSFHRGSSSKTYTLKEDDKHSSEFLLFFVCPFTDLVNILCKTIDSLRPSDTIWRHRSGSTLAQVMACCLKAPSHYLNQCWLIISKNHNFTRDTSVIND